MGSFGATLVEGERPAGSQTGAPATRYPECHFLCCPNGVSVATTPQGLSRVDCRLERVQTITRLGNPGTFIRRTVYDVEASDRSLHESERWDYRQPDGQDDGKGGLAGYDAGKKIKGRKRHIVTDVTGLPLAIRIQSADTQDRDGALDVILEARSRYETLKHLWADGGYAGRCELTVQESTGCTLEIVRRSDDAPREVWLEGNQDAPISKGFKVVKWRWIIERTFGWLGRYRRLSKDYEQSTASSLAWVRLALVAILLHRFGEI